MSSFVTDSLLCPVCGKALSYKRYTVLDTEDEPAAAEALVSGALFSIPCSCGAKAQADYPMLFSDAEHFAYLRYCLPEELESANEEMSLADAGSMRKRVVTSQKALQEKALIYCEDLEDQLIELMKTMLPMKLAGKLSGKTIVSCTLVRGSEGLCFELITRDGTVLTTPFVWSMYESAIDAMGPILPPSSGINAGLNSAMGLIGSMFKK